jgi:glycosyltransferase involved in cell wall biosynthesis
MLWQARRPIDRFRPDIIHVHGMPYANMFGSFRRTPGVLTVDYFEFRGSHRRSLHNAYHAFLTRYSVITAVSGYCQREFCAYWPDVPAPTVVPNGVNLEQFRPDAAAGKMSRRRFGLSADSPVLLYIGRVCAQKGSDTLAEAIPHIQRQIPNAQVVVAGPAEVFGSNGTSKLIAKIVSNGGTYLGALDDADLCGAYNMCDAFVMPTRDAEMFGMALAEAQACGRPAICSMQGGLTEVAAAGSALFFPPGDAVALARTATEMLTDPILREQSGRAAADGSHRFAWSRVARAYRGVYETAVARN